MGILYYFIGCIPVCIFMFLFLMLYDKLNIAKKIENFDNANSGPIYDFFKTIFLIIIYLIAIASIGCLILPMHIYLSFSQGNFLTGTLLSILCAIIFSIAFSVFDK